MPVFTNCLCNLKQDVVVSVRLERGHFIALAKEMIYFVSGSNSVVHISTFQTNMSAFREQKAVVHIFLVMWMLA